ncbi:MAG: cell division protein ZapB [Candidatus Micrarchaeaceae archaeon]
MAEESPGFVEPDVDRFHVNGTLLGTFEGIASRLTSLQLFYIKDSGSSLSIARVESRDIQKRPFLFFIITFSRDGIDVQYSIAKDSSPKMRRLYVVKSLASVLSLISDQYQPEGSSIFQLIEASIDDVLGSLSQSYSTLFNNYSALLNEQRELKRLNIELTAANRNLTVQATQLSSQLKDLQSRLSELESYSDESLMVMIEEWLESHDSAIDINEFAKNYKTNPTRVEQVLNKMVSLGYIELRG